MASPPLATVADLESRGVTVEDPETAFVQTALATASAAIREAAGCPISQSTSTIEMEGSGSAWLRLPGPPVVAVDTVVLDELAVTDWRLITGKLWRAAGWSPGAGPCLVTATYTHGLDPVPADIVDFVCRMAASALVSHRAVSDGTGIATDNVTHERIGDWAVNYGNDGRVSDMELTTAWRTRLAARFGGGAGMVRTR